MVDRKESFTNNLGSNEGYSVKEIIDEVNKYIHINYEIGPRRLGDPDKLIASNIKAKEILGWAPQYGLKDIIKSDIEYRKKI